MKSQVEVIKDKPFEENILVRGKNARIATKGTAVVTM